MKNISLILARSKNKVIGKENKLAWKISEDLKYFKTLTTNKIIIMGFKTFQSLNYKKLPNRLNIILSNRFSLEEKEYFEEKYKVRVFSNINSALNYCKDQLFLANKENEEIFVIGGGNIFNQFLGKDLVNKIYITEIDSRFQGDTIFNFDLTKNFTKISSSQSKGFEENTGSFVNLSFDLYEKIKQ